MAILYNCFCFLIFGWAFLVFGYLTMRLVIASLRMLHWERGKAILQKLVITTKASKYLPTNGPIEAVYAYEYQGVHYHGTRISVFDSVPDLNFGYGPLVFSRLNELFVSKQAIRIRFDPRHPEQSVLIDMPVRGPLWLGTAITLMSVGFLIYFYFKGATTVSVAIGLGSAFVLFLLSVASRNAFMFIAMIFGSL